MAAGQHAGDTLEARFDLEERVGGGSFGEVWRSRDRATGAQVAVKRMHAHLVDPGALQRFARESVMLSRIASPHVVRYVAHGEDAQGRPFLATEWLSGEELARYRTRADVSLWDTLAALRDAARGVATLHAAGVVHRDLKPANIFVCTEPDGQRVAKLIDLGIAHVPDATVLTASGMILGSPAYMAPEQVRGERVDSRADLWALGVVLFELIAGDTPFGSHNAIAVLGKVLLEPVPPLQIMRPGLPSVLYRLVEGLLEKSPDLRTHDAPALVSALDELLEREREGLRAAPASVAPGHASDVAGDPNATQPLGVSERRLVALVFARGEGLDAASSVSTLIGRFGGQVERLRDAWLGGFGLGRARGDELAAAARAALEARRSGARVALVSGWAEVRAGSVVTGPLIDRGAALLDRAGTGEVRVGRDAQSRLETDFELEPAGPTELRLVRELRAEVLRGAVPPPLLLGRTVPALGRDKERRLLEGVVLEAAGENEARVALVIGEAGLGKSRLLYELLRATRTMDPRPRTLVFRAEPVLSDAPNAMVVQGLREAIGLEDGEDPEAARAKVRAVCGKVAGVTDTNELDFLGDFLRIAPPANESAVLRAARQDPGALRERVRSALATLCRGVCAEAPLVLALEDLHWADRASLELLAWLIHALAEEPFAVVAFARPELSERHPALWKGVDRTELRLAPLSVRASEQLVAAVLPLPEAERKLLAQRAAGNPLFLQELVRARAEGLQELPAAVHSVLQARLDALGVDARRLAQGASVFGQTFWAEGAASLRAGIAVGGALAELTRAEVVTPRAQSSRLANSTEYVFNHALVRDAAYAMLVESERKDLHARAAVWLASAGESDPAVLGHHCEAGGRFEEAGAYFLRAASKALAESAFEQAERSAARALSCVHEGTVAAEALLVRAEARRALGRAKEMLDDARAAHVAAEGNLGVQIRALSRVGEALHVLGDLKGADETLRTVLEESHAALLSPRVHAILQLALVDIDAGRALEAATLADEALSWLADAGPGFEHQRLQALRARASASCASGDLPGALAGAQHALSEALAAPHRLRATEARVTLGRVLCLIGRSEEGLAQLRQALAEALAMQAPVLEAATQQALGEALSAAGRVVEAMQAFKLAEERGRGLGALRVALSARVYATLAALNDDAATAGSRDEAQALRRECEPFAPLRALADVVLARVLARDGAHAEALAVLERLEAVARAQGSSGEHDERARLAHAGVLDALGRTEDADRVLYQANERLMHKAAKWRAPDARAAFLEGVVYNRVLREFARERLGVK